MKETIIHISGDDFWGSNPHSRYHLSFGFYKQGYRILWINTIGTRFPSLKKKNKFIKRLFRKVKSILKFLRKIDKDFYVYTPIVFPVFRENGFQRLNQYLLKVQLKVIFILLKIKRPYLFYSTPVYADLIDVINYSKLIYYYSDQYTLYRELNLTTKNYLERLDKKLYSKADAIFCASKLIYNNLKEKTKKNVYYLPHVVDYEHFNKEIRSVPSDIALIKKPIIGYYGTLTDSNDWDLIKYCARKRKNYNFVFIGRKEIEDNELENMPNVYFLGKKEYNILPAYANQFNVCIMFWVRREWIKNSSPLKLKEYFSLGKPVVSTYIEEVADNYGQVVYIANSKEDFLNKLDQAIEKDNSERIKRGLEIVKDNSWLNLSNEILKKLN